MSSTTQSTTNKRNPNDFLQSVLGRMLKSITSISSLHYTINDIY